MILTSNKSLHTITVCTAVHIVLDALLVYACREGISDIHLQPEAGQVVVRMRGNGQLHRVHMLTLSQGKAISARIKVLCEVDSTQVLQPQDGAMRVQWQGAPYDVRVSFFPSLYGEKVVLRLLSYAQQSWQLTTLGLTELQQKQLARIVGMLHGFFLVTGPTGAGKTTTLYAMLRSIDSTRRNVVTLEDPIEYRISGITQTQIPPLNDQFSFASAMRSLLRQDPDVALIGEMRDAQTARSAIEAALTGHLVLSSLHTTQASSAPIRLREMGVPAYLVASSLTGVLAQRLVRLRCQRCKKGCKACHGTGSVGRQMVAELFIPDEQAREAMLEPAVTARHMYQHAVRCGMKPLHEQAQQLAEHGIIDQREVLMLCE